ncbi:hypothetical protein [Roseibium sp. TrichSKD4]|uniref:hypothetical protein n=1 Tax=Roseibium sp. TrichSKD4 TaxID=744980 RepID=UPI00058EEDF2|nr:hypothetical protein [Roseibium sp. TrichSKD4]
MLIGPNSAHDVFESERKKSSVPNTAEIFGNLLQDLTRELGLSRPEVISKQEVKEIVDNKEAQNMYLIDHKERTNSEARVQNIQNNKRYVDNIPPKQ